MNACKLVAIKPFDHIIVRKNQYFSFAENRLI
ncbi:MAG: JAB domain-containing protein [Candidatus Hodarchaeota archaeon]